MRGVFDEFEPELERPRRDTEVTLGTGTLLAIFLGLLLLCALCFGIGYEVGRRSLPTTTNLSPSTVSAPVSSSKPSAAAPVTAPQAAPAAAETVDNSLSVPTPSEDTGAAFADESAPPQARPAFSAQKSAAPRDSHSPQPLVHPSNATGAVVQVATLADSNDAEYLLEALKKRGYPATARRDGSHQIQVRVGPFASQQEANRWRQRLISDGYSATVLP